MKKLLIYLIKLYQFFLSPFIGNNCRFYPSCSAYGIEALEKHSILKGLILTIIRLLYCNPWGGSGYNPVRQYFSLKRFFIIKLYGIKRKIYKLQKMILHYE
jgi:putative membrane protein insertion efficiency factor